MVHAARRRRTQPTLPRVPSEPPDKPEQAELVTCFLSGARLAKSDAVLVRLGPGRVMWMAKELTNQG